MGTCSGARSHWKGSAGSLRFKIAERASCVESACFPLWLSRLTSKYLVSRSTLLGTGLFFLCFSLPKMTLCFRTRTVSWRYIAVNPWCCRILACSRSSCCRSRERHLRRRSPRKSTSSCTLFITAPTHGVDSNERVGHGAFKVFGDGFFS